MHTAIPCRLMPEGLRLQVEKNARALDMVSGFVLRTFLPGCDVYNYPASLMVFFEVKPERRVELSFAPAGPTKKAK